MALDVLHLLGPAALVHPKRFDSATGRNGVEPRLTDRQERAAGDLLQGELDQRRRLLGVVDRRIDGVRMPMARQTRATGAFSSTCLSILSVLMRDLSVA
jgi:hypothetical protein